VVHFSSNNYTVGAAGSGIRHGKTLSAEYGLQSTVTDATSDSTAVAARITGSNGTLDLDPGDEPKHFSVPILGAAVHKDN